MALNLQYETKDAVPAEALPHYTETDAGDGKKVWVLQGTGFVPTAKLDEFRNTNRELLKKTGEYETKFKDVDPELFTTLKGRAELMDGGKLIGLDKIEEKIKARLEPVQKELGEKLTATEERAKKAELRVAEFTIDKAAVDAAIGIGIAKGAQPDIIARVRRVFSLNEKGELIATKQDGSGKEWYGGNGEMVTPADYVKILATEAPHLFAPNSGGGGIGSGGGGGAGGAGAGGINPWDPKTFNLSDQMREYKANPDLARKRAAMFGKVLP